MRGYREESSRRDGGVEKGYNQLRRLWRVWQILISGNLSGVYLGLVAMGAVKEYAIDI